jgi:anti-sigma factor RsiW
MSTSDLTQVTCRGLILDYLSDYLDELLSPELTVELERHLARCPSCLAYLNTYRRTRELVGETLRVPMPEEMRAILRNFLVARLSGGPQ